MPTSPHNTIHDFCFFIFAPARIDIPLSTYSQPESQIQSTQDTRRPKRHLAPLNARLGEALAQIEPQVPQPVDEVVRKRESEQELDAALDGKRQRGKRRREARRLQVPPQQRRGQVRAEVDVRRARQRAARDARPRRVAQPRLLNLVDAQVGRHGPLQPLLHEDLVPVVLGDFGRRHGAFWPKKKHKSQPFTSPAPKFISSQNRHGVNVPSLHASSDGYLGHLGENAGPRA
ncbi:hypothetical protein J3458_019600 [Metarhizium acridum]|uniref:uncharacterized protein n=1 Tax=Metarhizium acridum TaxID=92637 RepID=UPI001C6C3EBC|nr:hypothetical protein J3458_019600 [Metarhizium acridum]